MRERAAFKSRAKEEKAPPTAVAKDLPRESASISMRPPVSKGEWGILVVDAVTGQTLYENNADSFFVPASNMKLFTTALALDTLGPDFRFRTTLETNGKLEDGSVQGDLILVGRGDPNLSNRSFHTIQKRNLMGHRNGS